MNITVHGAGYVGLVTAIGLSELGHDVCCLDLDPIKVASLSAGHPTFYEPDLASALMAALASGCLLFTTDVAQAVTHGSLQWIATGTPALADGASDLRQLMQAVDHISVFRDASTVVVIKSTVPVGTHSAVWARLNAPSATAPPTVVLSNPEFLREGSALQDVRQPDRIVVGARTDSRSWQAVDMLKSVYAPLVTEEDQWMVMSPESAELAKHAANAMLATRVSFMNELAELAASVGADIDSVRTSMGADPRIGPHYLQAGCGFGGSCLPKDLASLQHTASTRLGRPLGVLAAVEATNARQKAWLFHAIRMHFGHDLSRQRIGVWGLSFKPGTDDVREAPSLTVVRLLVDAGAEVVAHDPVAAPAFARAFGPHAQLHFAESPDAAAHQADALVILTEWPAYLRADWASLRDRFKTPIVFDGRQVCRHAALHSLGYQLIGVGQLSTGERA